MTSFLTIKTTKVKEYALALKSMHRSDFPIAVRNTLNNAAFDVKKRTLKQEARKSFKDRTAGRFFGVFSSVNQAKGFSIKTMRSEVGIVNPSRSGKKSDAAENMREQQLGGSIARKFIPFDQARTSNSLLKRVAKKNRLSEVGKSVNKSLSTLSTKGRRGSKTQRIIKTATFAVKKGRHFISHQSSGGNTVVYRVKKGSLGSGSWRIKTTDGILSFKPIYSVKKGRKVSIKPKPFTQRAALKTSKLMPRFFQAQAIRRIQRHKAKL